MRANFGALCQVHVIYSACIAQQLSPSTECSSACSASCLALSTQPSPAVGGSPYLLSELLQEAVPVALQCVGRQTCSVRSSGYKAHPVSPSHEGMALGQPASMVRWGRVFCRELILLPASQRPQHSLLLLRGSLLDHVPRDGPGRCWGRERL